MSDIPERLAAAFADTYEIVRKLGSGGMATVYLATDLKHDRQVAIKVLRPELAAVIGGERFISEIKTTAALQHPHILPLFDSGEKDSFLYYVMPYIDGETLRDRLDREKQLPVGEAVAIATKVAGALQAAHDEGVIHHDIKPANILLQQGEPVVSDFGIALAVSEAGGGRLTETGLSPGTPYYMAPEQATADRDPDQRSDIYSLACLTYEMLAGEPPFTGSSAQAVLGQILTQAPPHVSAERPSVPHNVDAAILQALQKLPADRFESVSAFANALNDLSYMGPAGRASGAVPGAAERASGRKTSSAGEVLPWAIAAAAILAAAAALALGSGDSATRWLDLDVRGLDPAPVFVGFTPAISPDAGTVAGAAVVGEHQGVYVRSRTVLLDVDSIVAFNPHLGTDDRIVITGPDGPRFGRRCGDGRSAHRS